MRNNKTILNCMDVASNPESYPTEYQILTTRAAQLRGRLEQWYGVNLGLGGYLKLTETCGIAFSSLIKENPGLRFEKSEAYQLLGEYNPKYTITCEVQGKSFAVIYDAFDRMITGVVPPQKSDPFHSKYTGLVVFLGLNGEARFENRRAKLPSTLQKLTGEGTWKWADAPMTLHVEMLSGGENHLDQDEEPGDNLGNR